MAQRVREGGHPVPPERILARYPRTIALLAQAVQLADVAYLYDAIAVDMTTGTGGPRLVAVRNGTSTIEPAGTLPAWTRTMLGK